MGALNSALQFLHLIRHPFLNRFRVRPREFSGNNRSFAESNKVVRKFRIDKGLNCVSFNVSAFLIVSVNYRVIPEPITNARIHSVIALNPLKPEEHRL